MLHVTPRTIRAISWVLALTLLLLVLTRHLVPALFAGLLVHELVYLMAPSLQQRISNERGRLIAITLLAVLVVGAAAAAVVGALGFLRSDAGSLASLFGKLAQIIEGARAFLPPWVLEYLPVEGESAASELRVMTVDLLRQHAAQLRAIGAQLGLALVHILVGMIIGAMIASRKALADHTFGPLSGALAQRSQGLASAFRRIVFAQVRISAINTILTALYLVLVLPLFDVYLPLVQMLIVVTFIAGLLPVIGNIISNTVIVVVCFAHSLHVMMASLVFLVVIHKLEYFLNARIVGSQIKASAWELLTAMLLMEAVFGLPGLIMAPIIYAWVKDELKAVGLV